MKIPKKLKVGAHLFDVKVTKVKDDAKGTNNWGKTSYARCNMYLDSELSQSRLEETFIHEILHVCFDQAGLQGKYKEESEEENLVNSLANQLYPILKNNNLLK